MEHVKKEPEELKIKYDKMNWLMNRKSKPSAYNKLLLYKQLLTHYTIMGICYKTTWNLTLPNKMLRNNVGALKFIKGTVVHRDLKMMNVVRVHGNTRSIYRTTPKSRFAYSVLEDSRRKISSTSAHLTQRKLKRDSVRSVHTIYYIEC